MHVKSCELKSYAHYARTVTENDAFEIYRNEVYNVHKNISNLIAKPWIFYTTFGPPFSHFFTMTATATFIKEPHSNSEEN